VASNFLFGTHLDSMLDSTVEYLGLKKVCKRGDNPNIWIVEEKNLIKELEERGYDITTLKFSVRKKRQDP
jgi:5-bromo-4-chloroindolyl phosphate hydrolysis protein